MKTSDEMSYARLHVVGQREQAVEHRRHHVRVRDAVLLDERAASRSADQPSIITIGTPIAAGADHENASGAAWYSGPVHRCTCRSASYCVSSADVERRRADRAAARTPFGRPVVPDV